MVFTAARQRVLGVTPPSALPRARVSATRQKRRSASAMPRPHENSSARCHESCDRLARQTIDFARVGKAQPRACPAPGRLARERFPPHGLTGATIERERCTLLRLSTVTGIKRQDDARRVACRQRDADALPVGHLRRGFCNHRFELDTLELRPGGLRTLGAIASPGAALFACAWTSPSRTRAGTAPTRSAPRAAPAPPGAGGASPYAR